MAVAFLMFGSSVSLILSKASSYSFIYFEIIFPCILGPEVS